MVLNQWFRIVNHTPDTTHLLDNVKTSAILSLAKSSIETVLANSAMQVKFQFMTLTPGTTPLVECKDQIAITEVFMIQQELNARNALNTKLH